MDNHYPKKLFHDVSEAHHFGVLRPLILFFQPACEFECLGCQLLPMICLMARNRYPSGHWSVSSVQMYTYCSTFDELGLLTRQFVKFKNHLAFPKKRDGLSLVCFNGPGPKQHWEAVPLFYEISLPGESLYFRLFLTPLLINLPFTH